jgi:glycosyltransferase involved in cell wall biosynthesis
MAVQPKVSICIPTFNQVEYLHSALESALKQDYDNLEVVISDNHSTDWTFEYLSRITDSRVRVVRPDKHVPMMDNWRFCISKSQGDYINVLSSDDLLFPDYTKKMVTILQSYPTAAFAYCSARLIDKEGNILGIRPYHGKNFFRNGSKELKNYLLQPVCLPSAMMMRRNSYERVGGFRTWKVVGDWDVMLRLLQIGDVVYHNEILAQYRIWSAPERDARFLTHLEEVVKLYETTVAEILRHHPELIGDGRRARRRRAIVWALQLGRLVDERKFQQAARLIMKIDDSKLVCLALNSQRSKLLSYLTSACMEGRWRLRQKIRLLRS